MFGLIIDEKCWDLHVDNILQEIVSGFYMLNEISLVCS